MLPTRTIVARRVVKPFSSIAFVVTPGLTGLTTTPTPSSALSPAPSAAWHRTSRQQMGTSSRFALSRAGGGAAVGPRGGAVAYRSRTAVRAPAARAAVVRPGYHGGAVRWARPASYRWPRGGAIAAGAAIGFVTAAVAWAGSAPGMCWYYTDPSRTQGFWDYCP